MFRDKFENRAIGAIRYLGLKSIQQAKGGHVGMTISAAPITYTLFTKFININPENGKWIGRDRFVLSGGHGSMCLYPIFYLSGIYDKQDLINFKTKDSKTPGHPEYEDRDDNFIDASTGPLGQGIAMGVGLALAQKFLELKTKNKYQNLFNNYTYILCGDGDLQEGISYEAMAIAGKYNLDKLILIHDSNKYQLDSSVADVSIENLELRAKSNNWFYQKVSNEPSEIEKAILEAKKSKKPSFIEVETIIAEGLPVQNSNKGHHGIVSEKDLENFNKYHNIDFKEWNIDQDILDFFKINVSERGKKIYNKWKEEFEKFKKDNEFKELADAIEQKFDYSKILNSVKFTKQDQATRVYLKEILSSMENSNSLILATCADLASSTNLTIGTKNFANGGQSLPLGIREFAMGAIMNGIVLYDKAFKVIGGTFLVFADYIKSAIRIGAMMELPIIYAFTHDSYLVGGDGPTHQPYDQLAMLRSIDNLNVYRPADEEELRYCFNEAFNSKKDTSIFILSRQNITSLNENISNSHIYKGAYIIKDTLNPDYVIAASGAEVQLALSVSKELENVRVISVPCLDKAVSMSSQELKSLFSAKKALITIEPSSDYKWYKLHLTNQINIHIGAYTFGKSMDGEQLYFEKGFNPKSIIETIKKSIK